MTERRLVVHEDSATNDFLNSLILLASLASLGCAARIDADGLVDSLAPLGEGPFNILRKRGIIGGSVAWMSDPSAAARSEGGSDIRVFGARVANARATAA
jgi:hypothetical protein